MPPRLPDRYRLNVRLGTDGDVEEWLATDEHLERPVLIRFPGPDADEERIASFLDPVRAAAGTAHPHIQTVYAAGESGGSAFAVAEWDGAVTIADRLNAGETIPITEYLPNAYGLAAGLAAFHERGGVHGAIDPSAIHFSAAHPARLASFGRIPVTTTPEGDTTALASALRTAVTGSSNPAVLPSHVAEGIPPSVDNALEAAEAGRLDAAGLSEALSAVSLQRELDADRRWTIRPLVLFALVVLLALVVSVVGLAIDVDPDSPFLFPAAPADQERSTPSSAAPESETAGEVAIPATLSIYDPYGDGIENDDELPNAADGDRTTRWETETYPEQFGRDKAGVGITIDAPIPIGGLEITASPSTRYSIAWSATMPDVPGDWERVGAAQIIAGSTRLDVPVREDGFWLVWITALSERIDGSYGTWISEIRPLP